MLNEVPKLRQEVKVKVDIVTSDDIKSYSYYTRKFQDFTARYVMKCIFSELQRIYEGVKKSFPLKLRKIGNALQIGEIKTLLETTYVIIFLKKKLRSKTSALSQNLLQITYNGIALSHRYI